MFFQKHNRLLYLIITFKLNVSLINIEFYEENRCINKSSKK